MIKNILSDLLFDKAQHSRFPYPSAIFLTRVQALADTGHLKQVYRYFWFG